MRANRTSVWVSVVLVAGTALLAVRLTTGEVPGVDRAVHEAALGRPGSRWVPVASTVTWLGSIWVLAPVMLLASAVFPRSDRPVLHGAWVMGALGLAVATRAGLQTLVARPRPETDGMLADGPGGSFPSGHTLQLTVALGLLVALYAANSAAGRRTAIAAAAALVALVALTRLYLGVHWLTDLVGGVLLGGVILWLWSLTAGLRPRACGTSRGRGGRRRGGTAAPPHRARPGR